MTPGRPRAASNAAPGVTRSSGTSAPEGRACATAVEQRVAVGEPVGDEQDQDGVGLAGLEHGTQRGGELPGVTSAPRSTGLRTSTAPGTAARRAALSSSEVGATTMPWRSARSVVSAPTPPVLETMHTRSPAGSGCSTSSSAVSVSSAPVRQAITPDWSSSASTPTPTVEATVGS